MQKVIKHEEGFAVVLVGLALITIAVVGFSGYYLIYKPKHDSSSQNRNSGLQEVQKEKNANDQPAQDGDPVENQPGQDEPVQTQPQKPRPSEFNAQTFYDQVQEGISYAEVQKLAGGKNGDCAQTAVYPPSGNVSCTWSDAKLRVTVHFTDDKVISKQKAQL